MNLELQDIARAISAAPPAANPVVTSYAIDSRAVEAGSRVSRDDRGVAVRPVPA